MKNSEAFLETLIVGTIISSVATLYSVEMGVS